MKKWTTRIHHPDPNDEINKLYTSPLWKNINLIIIAESSFFCKFPHFCWRLLFRIKLHDATSMCILIPPKNQSCNYDELLPLNFPPLGGFRWLKSPFRTCQHGMVLGPFCLQLEDFWSSEPRAWKDGGLALARLMCFQGEQRMAIFFLLNDEQMSNWVGVKHFASIFS